MRYFFSSPSSFRFRGKNPHQCLFVDIWFCTGIIWLIFFSFFLSSSQKHWLMSGQPNKSVWGYFFAHDFGIRRICTLQMGQNNQNKLKLIECPTISRRSCFAHHHNQLHFAQIRVSLDNCWYLVHTFSFDFLLCKTASFYIYAFRSFWRDANETFLINFPDFRKLQVLTSFINKTFQTKLYIIQKHTNWISLLIQ